MTSTARGTEQQARNLGQQRNPASDRRLYWREIQGPEVVHMLACFSASQLLFWPGAAGRYRLIETNGIRAASSVRMLHIVCAGDARSQMPLRFRLAIAVPNNSILHRWHR